MKLRCTKVMITGGGSGIGKAIAKRFVQDGANVVIAGRSKEKLKNVCDEINSENINYIEWDIAKVSQSEINFEKARSLMGGFDGLVNCAAIGTGVLTGRGYEPWDITEEEWDKLTDVNFKAAFFMMRNTVDYFIKNKVRGNILNIASNAVCMDIVGSYGAAKLAIVKWTRAFGKRYGREGIIINAIAPGATFTPMIARYAHSENQPYERHAIGRFIRTDEIAELAYYLMSDFGEIICGHTVVADGGDKAAF